jgi:uncharacterized protein with von Willebrand factor type A (vWA) domain
MERVLAAFVRALRAAGAPVSPSETIDATRAVAVVGYGDRAVLKNALGAVLAKSPEEKQVHDTLFELFFTRDTESEQAPGERSQNRDSDDEDPDADSLMSLVNSGGESAAAAIERAARTVGAENIRFATQIPLYTRRVLTELGVEHLDERIQRRFDEGSEEGDREARAMTAARRTLQQMARRQVARYFEVYGRSATENLMNDAVANRAIEALDPHDEARMKTLVARLAKRLADRHSRRRRTKDRGRLDVRKTIRAATAHDGIPFNLIHRIKKRDRPKIVVICDISGSVARYVRFLLMLLYALHDGVTDLRAFAFSSRLSDVDEDLRHKPFDQAMKDILHFKGGGSTDYGMALADLFEYHQDAIDRRTTVLVLGDARSNYGNPRLDLFAELADRVKRIVWLCPEPESLWGYGDSCMNRYRPYCTSMLHCATMADIERSIDDILTAYD